MSAEEERVKKKTERNKGNERELQELDREAKAVEESEEEGKEEFERENP